MKNIVQILLSTIIISVIIVAYFGDPLRRAYPYEEFHQFIDHIPGAFCEDERTSGINGESLPFIFKLHRKVFGIDDGSCLKESAYPWPFSFCGGRSSFGNPRGNLTERMIFNKNGVLFYVRLTIQKNQVILCEVWSGEVQLEQMQAWVTTIKKAFPKLEVRLLPGLPENVLTQ